jgi:rhodanese-related sulfurtransferase
MDCSSFCKKKKVNTKKPTSSADLLLLGAFQLEGILRNAVPHLFVDLQTDGERQKLKGLKLWGQRSWILGRAQPWLEDAFLRHLESENIDKAYPLILLCHSGEISLRIAERLEASGYRNVYVVQGGAWALFQSEDGD